MKLLYNKYFYICSYRFPTLRLNHIKELSSLNAMHEDALFCRYDTINSEL